MCFLFVKYPSSKRISIVHSNKNKESPLVFDVSANLIYQLSSTSAASQKPTSILTVNVRSKIDETIGLVAICMAPIPALKDWKFAPKVAPCDLDCLKKPGKDVFAEPVVFKTFVALFPLFACIVARCFLTILLVREEPARTFPKRWDMWM
mmetsp:Transcript_14380/g.15942  ORF Transcript_14380/g.15942 Transcript_14380/m.15942 type:complete len:150 (+) Transcript_14380:209-658(+)